MLQNKNFLLKFFTQRMLYKKESEVVCKLTWTHFDSFDISYLI